MTRRALTILPTVTGGFMPERSFAATLEAASLTEHEVFPVDLAEITAGHAQTLDDEVIGRLADAIAARAGEQVDLLAESIGATMALRLAAQRPTLVRSLMLVAPVGYPQPLSPPGGPVRACSAVTALYDVEVPAAHALAGLGSEFFEPTPDQATDCIRYRSAEASRLAGLVSAWWSAGAFDSVTIAERQEEIRGLRQPVHLVWGRDDSWVGLDGAFFLLRRLRSVQLRIIPRCGHLVSLEDPRTLGNTLRTFIESPGDSSAPDGAATGARVS